MNWASAERTFVLFSYSSTDSSHARVCACSRHTHSTDTKHLRNCPIGALHSQMTRGGATCPTDIPEFPSPDLGRHEGIDRFSWATLYECPQKRAHQIGEQRRSLLASRICGMDNGVLQPRRTRGLFGAAFELAESRWCRCIERREKLRGGHTWANVRCLQPRPGASRRKMRPRSEKDSCSENQIRFS